MKLSKLLINADCFLNGKLQRANIGILSDKIAYIGVESPEAREQIDCTGLTIFPGFIDSQVHFREPGLTHKEDIEHGSRGAAKGGVTAFFEMPNTKPPTTDIEQLQSKLSIAEKTSYTDYAFYAGATKENIGILDQLRKQNGCCGIKIFMGSSTGTLLLSEDSEIEKVLASVHSPIAVHSEDEDMLVEGKTRIQKGNVASHPLWRNSAVALSSTQRILKLARKTNTKVHLLHITTKEEAELLANNKNICTVEFTPQHLCLTAPEAYEKLGSFAQMNPPIRSQEHVNALWKALRLSVPDVFGSDHAPHSIAEKKQQYPNSPSGMPGVQSLPLVLLTQVLNGRLPLKQFVDMTTKNVNKVFSTTEIGSLEIGKRANLSIFDMKAKRIVTDDWMETKSGWTPFHGFEAKAWPIHTLVGGNFCLRDESLIKVPTKAVRFTHNH